MARNKTASRNFFLRIHPLQRVGISLIIAALVYLLLSGLQITALLRITASWLMFSLSYLVLSWIVLLKRPIPEIRKKAVSDDGSVTFVFIMVLLSSFASMVMVLLLMISKQHAADDWLAIPVSIGGMLSSWAMVHTMYSFHYAHRYYDNDETDASRPSGGLEFPGDDKPDYVDFAYFSFVIGCTFQVSDVEISSKAIRRIALVHGLLSFLLNTFVIALTINFVASLMN